MKVVHDSLDIEFINADIYSRSFKKIILLTQNAFALKWLLYVDKLLLKVC